MYIQALLRDKGKGNRFRCLAGPKTSAGFFLLREILRYALDLAVQLGGSRVDLLCFF